MINTYVSFGVTEMGAMALKNQIVGALAFLMLVAAIAAFALTDNGRKKREDNDDGLFGPEDLLE
jgi:hypothetical protein